MKMGEFSPENGKMLSDDGLVEQGNTDVLVIESQSGLGWKDHKVL